MREVVVQLFIVCRTKDSEWKEMMNHYINALNMFFDAVTSSRSEADVLEKAFFFEQVAFKFSQFLFGRAS
jgi:hypothetical protein